MGSLFSINPCPAFTCKSRGFSQNRIQRLAGSLLSCSNIHISDFVRNYVLHLFNWSFSLFHATSYIVFHQASFVWKCVEICAFAGVLIPLILPSLPVRSDVPISSLTLLPLCKQHNIFLVNHQNSSRWVCIFTATIGVIFFEWQSASHRKTVWVSRFVVIRLDHIFNNII